MGTALTVNQIKLLRSHLNLAERRDQIAVATDPDNAGWASAQKAFWSLTAADLDPSYIHLPDGLDPATLFENGGPAAVIAAIESRTPLGDVMIDQQLRHAGTWSDPAVRQQLIEHAAHVLAARGPETWLPAIERLRQRLHLAPGVLDHATVNASIERDLNPIDFSQAQLDKARALPVVRAAAIRQPHTPPFVGARETRETSGVCSDKDPTRADHGRPHLNPS